MKKNALILLVAVAISTVSCVDNAVSPQVEAIRSQQVEWMKAKTAGQVAENAMLAAETAYKVASDALLLKENEAKFAKLVADNADALIVAKYTMAKAKATFDAEMAALMILASAEEDKKVTSYLSNYTLAANKLATDIGKRLDAQNSLVLAQLTVADEASAEAAFLADNQSQIDGVKAEIAGKEAAIAVYNDAVSGKDVSAFEKELAALLLTRTTLELDNIKLLYANYRDGIVKVAKGDEVEALEITIAGKEVEISDLEDEIAAEDEATDAGAAAIVKFEAEIVVLQTAIKQLKAEVKVLNTSITTLTTTIANRTETVNDNVDLTGKNDIIIQSLSDVIEEVKGSIDYTTYGDSKTIVQKIETLEGDITLLNEKITTLEGNKFGSTIVAAKATIVAKTNEIAILNTQITAQEKVVAYWKALLDKIFTA